MSLFNAERQRVQSSDPAALEEPMRTLSHRVHHWIVLTERGLLRLLLVMIGLALILVSLLFDMSIVMLPLGLFLGLMGVGVVAWGVAGEVRVDDYQLDRPTVTLSLLLTPWDCRWGRLAYFPPHVREGQPESAWLCVRFPGPPRPVTVEDCTRCEVWEPIEETYSEDDQVHR